jgi:hypothetical protein
MRRSRREFLGEVGRGMLVASLGSTVAQDLGLASSSFAEESATKLTFGALEPLASLMEQTPADRLLPILVERMQSGTDLRQFIAAAALANARAFGGQDYDGYHAIMALAPSYQMSQEMPESQRALPVFKVLYRNTNHIQNSGSYSHEAMHALDVPCRTALKSDAATLVAATRRRDMATAEQVFATETQRSLDQAYNDLQYLIQDNVNVHRVVLAWRAWVLLDFTGKEHAHTLLRQSVRYCVQEEESVRKYKTAEPLRTLLPQLLDGHGLLSRKPGETQPDDRALGALAMTIYGSSRDKAAEAVANALADGWSAEAVGEAISIAANRLVLCDPGRRQDDTPAKPKGSVHGASVGVHACDAANAWRNIARIADHRNAVASLIVGAYHTAGQATGQHPLPYPLDGDLDKIKALASDLLLPETESAIKSNDQTRATALVARYGALGLPARPVFDLLLRYAISEDGALHAEKFYRTVTEEFASTRPAFRWRQLAALARVTASEYGHPAPGLADARRLLKV